MEGIRLAHVRFWQPQDLPDLRWFAALNAWQILPDDDRRIASIGAVATSAEENLLRVLSSPGGTAVVAEADGRPVGYMLVAVQPDQRTRQWTGYMADIYIDPKYRGAGIGAKFHEAAERYLANLGVRQATLWTHAHNPLGQRSAARRGYQLHGTMMSRLLN